MRIRKLHHAGMLVGSVALAASIFGAGAPVGAHQSATAKSDTAAATYSFTSIASPNDPTFTQLLGINKSGQIAGYFGSGADAKHPNRGLVLGLPANFSAENYPSSAQTQVIGINNHGDTDGFYVDGAGVTHGFTHIGGVFITVDVPGTTFNQLLGINNNGQQAGYYQYGPASGAIFVPFVHQADGSFLLLPIRNAQATGINDHGLVSGFANDKAGNAHGFLWQSGITRAVNVKGAVSTQLLGVNNLGQAAGTYTDSQKVAHGLVYDSRVHAFTQVDVPGSTSTVVNGINRLGWLTGFYTDAKSNTIGFVAKPSSL